MGHVIVPWEGSHEYPKYILIVFFGVVVGWWNAHHTLNRRDFYCLCVVICIENHHLEIVTDGSPKSSGRMYRKQVRRMLLGWQNFLFSAWSRDVPSFSPTSFSMMIWVDFGFLTPFMTINFPEQDDHGHVYHMIHRPIGVSNSPVGGLEPWRVGRRSQGRHLSDWTV